MGILASGGSGIAGGGGGGRDVFAAAGAAGALLLEVSDDGVDARLLLLVFSLGVSDFRLRPPFFFAAAFLWGKFFELVFYC